MTPAITVEALYAQAKQQKIEIPVLNDVVTLLQVRPGITVKEMSKLLGQTPDTLSYTVHLLTGQPLNLVIRQWRIWRCQDLLHESELSYPDVAARCGFTTVQAMSRFLDRWTERTAYEHRVGKPNRHRPPST